MEGNEIEKKKKKEFEFHFLPLVTQNTFEMSGNAIYLPPTPSQNYFGYW